MRISTRVGRGTYVSMGCLGWTLVVLAIIGLIGWVVSAAGHAATRPPAPASYTVRITPAFEDTNFNCVPASASMFLSAFGLRASQDRLAWLMGTSGQRGAGAPDTIRVLDMYLAGLHTNVTDTEGLTARQLADTLTAQLRARHPVMLAVWGNRLPWRLNLGGAHEIVVTGIRGQDVTVFDPARDYHGGFHHVPVSTLARILLTYMPNVLTAG